MCVYITYFTCRYLKYSTYKTLEVFMLHIQLYVFLTLQLAYGMDSNCIAKDPARQCQFRAKIVNVAASVSAISKQLCHYGLSISP